MYWNIIHTSIHQIHLHGFFTASSVGKYVMKLQEAFAFSHMEQIHVFCTFHVKKYTLTQLEYFFWNILAN